VENPRQGFGDGEVLEMADVEFLVEVRCEAFEDDRLCGRCVEERQFVVRRREVVVVEAVLLNVGVTGRQVSEATPGNRNRRLRKAARACTAGA
jgi:hypothetical protein